MFEIVHINPLVRFESLQIDIIFWADCANKPAVASSKQCVFYMRTGRTQIEIVSIVHHTFPFWRLHETSLKGNSVKSV